MKRLFAISVFTLLPACILVANAHGAVILIKGELTRKDKINDGHYFDVHKFKMAAGTKYTIDLVSKDFDTFLSLADPKETIVASNDDVNDGKDKNLNSRLIFTPTVSG